jgi:hypothetical protein
MGKPWHFLLESHGKPWKTMGFRILHDFLEVSKYGNGGKNVSSDWFKENLVV